MEAFALNKFSTNHPDFFVAAKEIAEVAQDLILGCIAKSKFLASIRDKLILPDMPQTNEDCLLKLIKNELRR